MIFPKVRISELEKDLDEKRAAYHNSRENLKSAIRERLKLIAFLKDHAKLMVGSLAALLTTTKILRKKKLPKGPGLVAGLLDVGWKMTLPILIHALSRALEDRPKKNGR